MGGCIKLCFGFVFFSVFKSVPNSSQKPLLSSPWSLLENIFVQAFEKSGSFQSYNKVLWFFFFSSTDFLSLIWLFCCFFFAEILCFATPDQWCFPDKPMGLSLQGSWCCWCCIESRRDLSRASLPDEGRARAPGTAAVPPCSHMSRGEVGAWPQGMAALRAWCGIQQKRHQEETAHRWMLPTVGSTWQVVL